MGTAAPVAPKSKAKFASSIGQLHYEVLDELVEILKDELGTEKSPGATYDGLSIRDKHESLYFQRVMDRFPQSSTKDSQDYDNAVQYLHRRGEVFDGIYGPRSQYLHEAGSRKAVRTDNPKFESPATLEALRVWGTTIIYEHEKDKGQWS